MRAQSTARVATTLDGGIFEGNVAGHDTRSIAQVGLPISIVERLAAVGVTTFEDWSALGRRRRQIFGITTATAKQIDGLAQQGRL